MNVHKRGRGRPRLNKVDVPTKNSHKKHKNQNKRCKINQQQTEYQHSSSESQEQFGSKYIKWTQQKLQLTYKPQKIIGRQKQKQIIQQFIDGCIMKQITNRCLCNYLIQLSQDISGCPGIGKTLTVMQIVKGYQERQKLDNKKIQFIYLNSLNFKMPSGIYKHLLLVTKKIIKSRRQPYLLSIQFDEYLKNNKTKKQFIFIIDEVDFLYTKNQNVLYNLAQWCSNPIYHKFSMIVIANTIDFPQKLSPKIKSRMGSWRLCFKPYVSGQIKQILQQRLLGSDLFEPKAFDFITKKFSALTSDLRKIFKILKQVIENRKDQQVKIQDVLQIWTKIVQEQQLQWQQLVDDVYHKTLDIIKSHGGKSHSYSIYKILSQQKISYQEIQFILDDLKEMGLVKTSRKSSDGIMGWEVTIN